MKKNNKADFLIGEANDQTDVSHSAFAVAVEYKLYKPYKNMKRKLCNLLGHFWKYYFSMSDSHNQRADIRVCKFCGDAQIYKRCIPYSLMEKEEYVWMNMIGFTKLGAKKHHGKNIEG